MAFFQGQLDAKVLINASSTTTVTGTAVDLSGTHVEIGKANCLAVLTGTARTYTGSPTVIVTIEESNTSAFTTTTVIGTFTTIATTAATSEAILVSPTKEYVRGIATFSADTTTGAYSLVLLLNKRSA